VNFDDEITIYYLIALSGVAGLVIAFTYNSNSYTNGYNKAVKFCVEQPQNCKNDYKHLKLQENNK
jgi:hypothetical protein